MLVEVVGDDSPELIGVVGGGESSAYFGIVVMLCSRGLWRLRWKIARLFALLRLRPEIAMIPASWHAIASWRLIPVLIATSTGTSLPIVVAVVVARLFTIA